MSTPDQPAPRWSTGELQRFLAQPDPAVRAWALKRLLTQAPPLGAVALRAAVEDAAPEVQHAVVWAIRSGAALEDEPLRRFVRREDVSAGYRLIVASRLASRGDAEALALAERLDEGLAERREQLLASKLATVAREVFAGDAEGASEGDANDEPDDVGDTGDADNADDADDADDADGADGARDAQDGDEKAAAWLRLDGPAAAARVVELLRGPPDASVLDGLQRLEHEPGAWLGPWLGEHLDALLSLPWSLDVWETVREVGEPALLPRVLEEWRPGEPFIAGVADFLARLGSCEEALPAPVRAEVTPLTTAVGAARAFLEGPDHEADQGPLRLPLRCPTCRRAWEYEFEEAYLNFEGVRREGDDPASLPRVVACKRCGAQDEFEWTVPAKLAVMGHMVLQQAREPPERWRIRPIRVQLEDGTRFRRPMDAVRILRGRAAATPRSGEAWRRLGRTCDRVGLDQEGEDALRRALEDPREALAWADLAGFLYGRGRTAEAAPYVPRAIEKLVALGSSDPAVADALRAMCELLRQMAPAFQPPLGLHAAWRGASAVLVISAADLRELRRWDALADALAGGHLLDVRFSNEFPAGRDTDLLRLLESGGFRGRSAAAPRAAKAPGRNEPCPCGSGLKYKRCCLG